MTEQAAVQLTVEHKLLAAPTGDRSVCIYCKVESEVFLVEGAAVRQFRRPEPGSPWMSSLLCPGAPPPTPSAPPPGPYEGMTPKEALAAAEKGPARRREREQVMRKAALEADPTVTEKALDERFATAEDIDAAWVVHQKEEGSRATRSLHRALIKLGHPDATDEDVGHLLALSDEEEEAAEWVDLSEAFSPVIFSPGGSIPSQAVALDGGNYRVYLPESETMNATTTEVSAARLRVMRARYLLTRGRVYRDLSKMPPQTRAAWERLYFPEGVFVPAPGSRLAAVVQTGRPLTIELEGRPHGEVLAALLSEAGTPASALRLVVVDDEGKLYAAPLVAPGTELPAPPLPPAPVPCFSCGVETPGGVCDGCIRMATELDIDLQQMWREKGPWKGAMKRAPKALPPAPPPVLPPALTVPPRALLSGVHDKTCGFWRVNDPSVLDVSKVPEGLRLCQEHWERVRAAQGGTFRVFAPPRDYVGGRYR